MAKKRKSKTKAKKTEAKSSVKSYQQGIDTEKQKMATYAKKMGSSVKSYQQGIDTEKQKMATYAKKMGSSVKSLQAEFKRHSKEMDEAGRNMIAEGNRKMNAKVGKFTGEIKAQIKENKEAIVRIENSVKFFLREVNKKKKDFQAYARGPFNAYIKAFRG